MTNLHAIHVRSFPGFPQSEPQCICQITLKSLLCVVYPCPDHSLTKDSLILVKKNTSEAVQLLRLSTTL